MLSCMNNNSANYNIEEFMADAGFECIPLRKAIELIPTYDDSMSNIPEWTLDAYALYKKNSIHR